MIMTLQEVMDTCPDWDKFCQLHGINIWAVNEGYGDRLVSLTLQQAHHLGIVKLKEWKIKHLDFVYPPKKELNYEEKNG